MSEDVVCFLSHTYVHARTDDVCVAMVVRSFSHWELFDV